MEPHENAQASCDFRALALARPSAAGQATSGTPVWNQEEQQELNAPRTVFWIAQSAQFNLGFFWLFRKRVITMKSDEGERAAQF
jgi:hypothetical protein